ncbi:hypothetical protein FACS1894169_10920 [Bacteroidia bacterium]|nr:hypothetical protein FACS1894169_10920 [Bacteroidia bacterium]
MGMKMDNIKDLQEELFCLKFELETLSEHLVKDNLERMLPNFSRSIIEYTHKERYKLITDIVENKEVIDIACGTGYGSFYLAQHGNVKNITGYDLSSDTIRYASHRYKHPNLSYKQGDAEKLEVDNKVDVIVSYETIEHLPNYKAFLEAINKNRKR